jgi:hypothetical protein
MSQGRYYVSDASHVSSVSFAPIHKEDIEKYLT